MGRKSTTTKTGKASASSTPVVATTPASAAKSSILKSSFAPSRYQLRLFASVIQSFESQQLRIHDTSNGRLRCEHSINPSTTIICLDWGQYNPSRSHSGSRKKNRLGNKDDVVVAYGTSSSEICMFSPAEGKVLGQLLGGHERGIRDFKFSSQRGDDAWSLGGDGKLVQWNIRKCEVIRSISVPDPAITTLSYPSTNGPTILCASTTPFAISAEARDNVSIQNFDSLKNTVRTLIRSNHDRDGNSEFFLANDEGRNLHVYDIEQKKLVRTLIAGGEVIGADLFQGEDGSGAPWNEQLLSVTTRDGLVELFPHPFVQPVTANGELKSSRKSLTQKAAAKVQLVQEDSKSARSPIFAASIQGPDLLIASVDRGVEISFQKIRWQDEGTGELLFDGVKEVVRSKSASSLNTATTNGVKDMGKSQIDESQTVVLNGAVEGSSQAAAIELDDSDVEDAEEKDSEEEVEPNKSESVSEDEDSEDVEDATDPTSVLAPEESKEDAEESAEPSFGDMLAARHPDTIDVADAFQPEQNQIAESSNGLLSLPTGMSLGTVLTQSLRTNDRGLLEACLHTTDRDIIENTIRRLESPLAGILVGKIAERMASRPGRYGDLQIWVRQLCVAHGAAISNMPEAKQKLRTLFKVLDQRAKMLTPLLLLRGKLDMLDAQITFRKQLIAERAARQAASRSGGMIYIEGEGDNWDSDEDDMDETGGEGTIRQAKKAKRLTLEDLIDEEGSDDDDDEEMPLANGISHSASTSDSDDSDEEDDDIPIGPKHGRLVDDIAEEDEESDDADSSLEDDEDDDDSGLEDDEDDDEEEEDSEMDDFIDDTPITTVDDDVDHDEDEDGDGMELENKVEKPATKKRRKY